VTYYRIVIYIAPRCSHDETRPDKNAREIGIFAGKLKKDLSHIKEKIGRIESRGLGGKKDVSDRLG